MIGFYVPGDLVLNDAGTDAAADGTALENIRTEIINEFSVLKGSWTYDLDAGVRYDWLTSKINLALGLQRQELRAAFQRIDGVSAIDRLALRLDAENRILYCDYAVRTQYGILDDRFGLPLGDA